MTVAHIGATCPVCGALVTLRPAGNRRVLADHPQGERRCAGAGLTLPMANWMAEMLAVRRYRKAAGRGRG